MSTQAIDTSTAPQLNIPTTSAQRRELGVESAYVDDYIQQLTAQYNNEYNAWLTNQQLEYNSPANQVKRLQEAGLNPNFNSIDGTGNLNSITASNAKLNSNVQSNKIQQTQTALQAVNNFLGIISDGVKKYSDITGGTMDLGAYKDLTKNILREQYKGQGYKNTISAIDMVFDAYMKGGANNGYTTTDNTIVPLSSLELYDKNGNPAVLELSPSKSLSGQLQKALLELRHSQDLSVNKKTQLTELEKELKGLQITSQSQSNQLGQKEIDFYEMNKLAGPVLKFLQLIFGR